MKGLSLVDAMPLHQRQLDRKPRLQGWLEEGFITNELDKTILEPKDWFRKGPGKGSFFLLPPISGSGHGHRHKSMHLIVVPRMMTGHWRKHLTQGMAFIYVSI
jgi:hypothetical protein